MSGTDNILSARDVRVSYGTGHNRRQVLHGVDLDVPRGATVGLVGESGSGKSSFGNALLGLVPLEAGDVTFEGEKVRHRTRQDRLQLARRMQVVFQDPFGSMNPARTIADTLSETLRFNLGLPAAEVTRRVEAALADVGLPTSVLSRYPGQFSGGQRQRIAIARAIAVEPTFLVCDEPVSALDLSVQAQVLNVFARLKQARGLSYLFISHDLAVVRFLSDRIVVLYAGRVVEEGPASVVADEPAHPYTRALVAAAPVPDPAAQRERRLARGPLTLTTSKDSAPEGGCSFVNRCPFAVDVCLKIEPPLESKSDGRKVACHRYDDLVPGRIDKENER